PGRDEDVSVADRAWQLSLFVFRERHALEGVARRLQKGLGSGADPFEVFNAAQDHVLLAARAHVDREGFEHLIGLVDRCPDPAVAALLDEVCNLHALSMLERDRAWFLEHGRLTPTRSKAVISGVNEACRRLRPHAAALVDAWGIPEAALGAPIA